MPHRHAAADGRHLAANPRSPRLLVLGHVTRDRFGAETRLGGAAAFAARAAVLLGLDTALVTVAPRDAPELDALRALPGLELEVAPSGEMTTFALEYSGERRKLALERRARPITWRDIPAAWRRPELLYLGPVAGECDGALLERFGDDVFAFGCLQGWLRDPVPGREVRPRPLPAQCRPPRALRAVSFSASDHPSGTQLAEYLARHGIACAVTRGSRGARLYTKDGVLPVPAAPAHVVDPTGAGDVFALVFGWSAWSGFAPAEAARRAAYAAARVVEGPGLGTFDTAARLLSSSSGSALSP